MKKTFALIAKKAMVYALTAAMLVSTPLTVSAAEADYSDAFDKFELTVNPDYPDTDESGTDTITETDTTSLVVKDNESNIEGIVIYPSEITLQVGDRGVEVRAEIKANVADDVKAALAKKITWHLYKPGSYEFDQETRKIVKPGQSYDKDPAKPAAVSTAKGDRTTAYLKGIKKGDVDLVCAIDDWKNDIHFAQVAKVHVVTYATNISMDAFKVYPKQSYQVERYVNGVYVNGTKVTDDTFTWLPLEGVKKKDAKVITLKNGILKISKKPSKTKKFTLKGVSNETGKTVEAEVTVGKAKGAKSVVIYNDSSKAKKTEKLAPGEELVLTANMFTKAKGKGKMNTDGGITDQIKWSLNAKGKKVVSIDWDPYGEPGEGSNVTITPIKAGTATLTAKSTSGKKATVKVKVTATMTGLTLTQEYDATELYYKQTMKLTATRDPEESSDALKWSVSGKGKKFVKVKNGTVSFKKKLTKESSVKITVQGKAKKLKGIKATYDITLKPSKVTGVTILQNGTDVTKKTDAASLYVGATPRKYTAVVAPDGYQGAIGVSCKKFAKATVDPDGNIYVEGTGTKAGTARVTVTYYNNKGKKKTTYFNVKVVVPATSVTVVDKDKKVKNGVLEVAAGASVSVSFNATPGPKGCETDVVWFGTKGKDAVGTIASDGKGGYTITNATANDVYYVFVRTASKKATANVKIVVK